MSNDQTKGNFQKWIDWAALGVILLLAVLYAWTMLDVPFHPDESTHIFMSKDFDSLWSDPLSLSWQGNPVLSDEERIRAIDAPLAKYLIGFSRTLSSVPQLAADWNWSLSWEENVAAGALPSRSQLLSARAVITLLLPFSLWLYYQSFKKILPEIPSLAAVLLLGLNPLVLLHGRRAMSEGVILLGIGFLLWTITREKRNPWLIGLAIAISFNAKHSTLGLLPAALLAVILLPNVPFDLQKAVKNLLKSSIVFLLTFLLLNPFYWKQPIAAISTGIEARLTLAREMEQDHLDQSENLRSTIPGIVLNTYFTTIQTEEVGNYLAATRDARDRYLDCPLHNIGRGVLGGSLLLVVTLAGIWHMFRSYRDLNLAIQNRYLILAISTLGICTFTAFLLSWQRYVVPLLPFAYCWFGAGLAPFFQAGSKVIAFPNKKNPPD
jgi:hypothetical protein